MRPDCACIPITHARLSPISDSNTQTHVLNIPFCHSQQLQISSLIALLPQSILPQSISRKPIFDPFPYPPCSAPPTQQRPPFLPRSPTHPPQQQRARADRRQHRAAARAERHRHRHRQTAARYAWNSVPHLHGVRSRPLIFRSFFSFFNDSTQAKFMKIETGKEVDFWMLFSRRQQRTSLKDDHSQF